MARHRSIAALALLLAACATHPTPRGPDPKEPDPRGDAFEAWIMGERLFHLGLGDADSDALIMAARLMERYPAEDAALSIESEPGSLITSSPTEIPTPESARKAAEALGRASLPAAAARGRGPRRASRELGPSGRDFVELDQEAGLAEVAVVSDGRSDLDLWVLDDRGEVVCADVAPGDARCRWQVRGATSYDLVIKNVGTHTSRYSLVLR